MRNIRFHLIAVFALLSIAQSANALSTTYGRTIADLRTIEWTFTVYKNDHGVYPLTDEHSSWYRKLVDEELLGEDPSQAGDPYAVARDQWGNEILLVHITPNPGALPDIMFYSVGADGIDDHGAKDDIMPPHWVNDGYYNKRLTPLARKITRNAGITLVAVTVLWMLFIRSHWRLWIICSCLSLGALGIILEPMYDTEYRYRPAGSPFGFLGYILFLFGFAYLIVRSVTWCVVKVKNRSPDACPSCNYDLTGLPDQSPCPECGHSLEAEIDA